MNRIIRQFGCIALGAAAMALAVSTDANAQKKYTFGYDQPHATAYGIAADMFNAKLMELSKGTMGIDQFPGAQLGQEPVMLEKIRTGDIDFIITATANAASVAPQAGVFSEHFIFRDKNHLVKVLADPAVTKEFKAMIADSVKGAHVLGLMTMGMRNMYSKFPIHSVADIKGKKIRVQATMTEDAHFPAYGAQTVHMPFGEVYTSLQTGVVAIAENGVNVYMANKHYEVRQFCRSPSTKPITTASGSPIRLGTASRRNNGAGCRQQPTKSPSASRRWLSSSRTIQLRNSKQWASPSTKKSTNPASWPTPSRSRTISPRSLDRMRSSCSNSCAT